MSSEAQIKKLYIVKKRIDFWKEDESVRKCFVDKVKANTYLEQLSSEDAKIPTIVFIEEGLCVQDTNQEKVYMLKGKTTPLEKEIFIEFA